MEAPFSSSIVSPRSYIVSSPNSLFLNFKSPRSLTIRASSSSSSDSVVTLLDYGAGNAIRHLGFTIKDISFLNITGFRDFSLGDLPIIQVLRYTSENVFVPLTVGGGIRDFTDASGRSYSSLEVAAEYFRSGADKISIGSDAVYAAQEFIKSGVKTGKSSLEHTSSLARSDRTEFLDLMLDDVYHLSRSTEAP